MTTKQEFTMEMLEAAGEEATISATALFIDDAYARPPSIRRVNVMARDFDWRLFTRVVVAYRSDQDYAVIDGNHRVNAARKKYGEEVMIPCIVLALADTREEAQMFRDLNKNRLVVSSLDIFHADLEIGAPDAKQVWSFLMARGLHVPRKRNSRPKGAVSAIGVVRRCYNTDPQSLRRILDLLVEVWGREPVALRGRNISGMFTFYRRYKRRLKDQRVKKALERTDPLKMASEAEEIARLLGRTAEDAWSAALLKNYNHGLNKEYRITEQDRSRESYGVVKEGSRD